MMRFLSGCFFAASAICGHGCSEQEKPSVVALADSLEKSVEELRGLRFRKPVEKGLMTAKELRELFQERLREAIPPEKMRVSGRVGELLGLLPEGYDLEKEILDFLSVGVGGVFDPKTKKFYLAEGIPSVLHKTVIVHEMTHALDDQYFDLHRYGDTELSEDAQLGRTAVVEGSAMLVMNLYQLRTPGLLKEMMAGGDEVSRFASQQSEVLRKIPAYLARSLLAGYIAGPAFLAPADLSDAKRQERVVEAYQNPPRSSEQILHPEKYWEAENRDEPMRVGLPDVSGLLGEGWKEAGADTLGELNVATLTEDPGARPDFSNPAAVAQISWTNEEASGWGGDRWEAYEKGSEMIVFWLLAWDRPEDAKEFLSAYKPPFPGSMTLAQDDRVLVVAAKKSFPGLEKAAQKILAEASVARGASVR